ncbi:MAG: hypothetical protein HOC20_05765 [Chloroflexi bacterium]|jgi:hypothetical protein|nr:hypothetical protein [Chloroflexota bacterium]
MFCKQCGSENPDDGGFCQKCGGALGSSAPAKKGKGGNKAAKKTGGASVADIGGMISGLPIATILLLGAALALFLAFLTGILAAAGAPDYVEGSTQAGYFFDHMVTGIMVCGILAGLAVLSKGALPEMVKALPIGMILIFGAVIALFLAFLTGILYSAGADGAESAYKGSLFFEQMVNGILVCGILGGLSLLISKQ